MRCEYVRMPGGGVAIVCHSGQRWKRCACGTLAAVQCDYPAGRGRTCDRYLCRSCAVSVGPDRDYCPIHPEATQIELAL